ncbi:c-type cytochrome [Pseudoduganella sp. UC29_106]|uniref:c-type cytochrome n=1 Tax=Pseudoduganella sp. UC29_106 TaxID=3374553 RepID=UPI003757C0D4
MAFSSTVRTLFRLLLGLIAAALLAGLGGWAVLEAGWYDAGATRQHFQFVHTLLERGMHQSVRFHARDIVAPPGRDAVMGAASYKAHCQQCHGGPGVAQGIIGLSMQPVPGPLVDASRRFEAKELYWVIRHGIKMSGMPAWGFHLSEQEMWAIVAFLERLPHMTPDEYRAADPGGAVGGDGAGQAGRDGGQANATRGKLALTQWACQACHLIPGVTGPDTHVGPPLKDLAKRRFIAGTLPMGEENLVRWITKPHEVDPATAMPQLGVPERDARDMAAYLLSQ